jgi:hypothetical protein
MTSERVFFMVCCIIAGKVEIVEVFSGLSPFCPGGNKSGSAARAAGRDEMVLSGKR